jgi:DNA-binding NtrC family response regulator
VIELKRENNEKRFSYTDERKIRLLSVLFGSAFHDYDPLSGSSELEDFNLHLIEKRPFMGQSLNSQKINHMIRKIAHSSTPLMIIGEKGTGKTVFAKICLKKSPLHHSQTDQLDFASVAPNEIDKVDWSEPGSVILESLDKLPKIYQRHLYERIVFGRKRIFTLCTNDLAPMTLSNQFYQPLYQYLSQAYFILQPLRQRKDELIGLASQILKNECLRRADKVTRTFSPQTLQDIEEYDWPENFTEMEKLVRKALFKSPNSEMISLEIPKNTLSNALSEQMISYSDHTLDKKTLLKMLKEIVEEHFSEESESSKEDKKTLPSKIAI